MFSSTSLSCLHAAISLSKHNVGQVSTSNFPCFERLQLKQMNWFLLSKCSFFLLQTYGELAERKKYLLALYVRI